MSGIYYRVDYAPALAKDFFVIRMLIRDLFEVIYRKQIAIADLLVASAQVSLYEQNELYNHDY